MVVMPCKALKLFLNSSLETWIFDSVLPNMRLQRKNRRIQDRDMGYTLTGITTEYVAGGWRVVSFVDSKRKIVMSHLYSA